MKLHCNVSTTLDRNDSLWSDWTRLLTRAEPALQIFSPEWYRTWLETLGSTGRWTGAMQFVEVRDALGVLRGLMPLGVQKLSFMTVHSLAGNWQPWRTILADPICERDVGIALGQFLVQSGIYLARLGPARRSDPAVRGLTSTLEQQNSFVALYKMARLATATLPDTWDEFAHDTLGRKFLSELRRRERRARKTGTVDIEHVRQPTPDETARLVECLGDIEQRSWLAKAKNGRMRFAVEPERSFWQRLIDRSLSLDDQIDAWVMRLDEKPVSFCFTLTSETTRYVIANQYDTAVKTLGTGKILYREMIQDSIRRGIRCLDFGDGELHYKKDWGASYQESLDTYVVVPNPWLGRAARTVWSFHRWRRPMPNRRNAAVSPDPSSTREQTSVNAVPAADSVTDGITQNLASYAAPSVAATHSTATSTHAKD